MCLQASQAAAAAASAGSDLAQHVRQIAMLRQQLNTDEHSRAQIQGRFEQMVAAVRTAAAAAAAANEAELQAVMSVAHADVLASEAKVRRRCLGLRVTCMPLSSAMHTSVGGVQSKMQCRAGYRCWMVPLSPGIHGGCGGGNCQG